MNIIQMTAIDFPTITISYNDWILFAFRQAQTCLSSKALGKLCF